LRLFADCTSVVCECLPPAVGLRCHRLSFSVRGPCWSAASGHCQPVCMLCSGRVLRESERASTPACHAGEIHPHPESEVLWSRGTMGARRWTTAADLGDDVLLRKSRRRRRTADAPPWRPVPCDWRLQCPRCRGAVTSHLRNPHSAE